MFYTCADFFPFLVFGKKGVASRIPTTPYSLAENLIAKLDIGLGNSLFSFDQMGIISWVTSEEVKLLYYDKHHLKNLYGLEDEFLGALEHAFHHDLGLLTAVDLDYKVVEMLPSYKFISQDQWNAISPDAIF